MYIMFGSFDIDWAWRDEEIKNIVNGWKEGKSVGEMAGEVKRDVREVFLLCVDLSLRGRIKERKGGVFGNCG